MESLLQSFFFFPFYSSGLWSPIDTACSPNFHSANSFSAFGSSNSFNLTGGSNPCGTRVLKTKECWRTFILDKHAFLHTHCFCVCFVVFSAPKSPEPQQSWSDITSVSSSIWDVPSSDSLHSWPSSSSSPTAPTAVRAWICLSCQYFLVCEHAAFIELLFFFFFPPVTPGKHQQSLVYNQPIWELHLVNECRFSLKSFPSNHQLDSSDWFGQRCSHVTSRSCRDEPHLQPVEYVAAHSGQA